MRWNHFLGASLIAGHCLVSISNVSALPPKPPVGGDQSGCLDKVALRVSASPASVVLGQSSTVTWSAVVSKTASDLCPQRQFRLNGASVADSGSMQVRPTHNSVYTVTASEKFLGLYREKSVSARVAVGYPDRVVVNQNTSDPVGLIIGALTDPSPSQRTVELCNVTLDFTGKMNILVGSNRSLIASKGCERGARSTGSRIFVSATNGAEPLFRVHGDNVVISGFELQGPRSSVVSNDTKDIGILIEPDASTALIQRIEISNMEISGWPQAGVSVLDTTSALAERGRLVNTTVGAVTIKGSFIHHNQHDNFGYGVVVGGGAYALIEKNVFDYNRHAIGGDSKNANGIDFSGYTARDNLILSGGGHHCNSSTGICWKTHQIDMHGDGSGFFDGPHGCGTAGETMIIERNTILYEYGHLGYVIKIRGNPLDKVVIDHNVFRDDDDSIAQNGACGIGDNITKPIDVRPNNAFNVDPMAELGTCDFVGDGQLDQFMATGVTWWAKSPVTNQWRYLNTKWETLPQLWFAKVDGDNACDVALKERNPSPFLAAPIRYVSGGVGASWLTTNPTLIGP